MKWINKKKNRRELCKIAKQYNINELLAQVLINRGFNKTDLDLLLNNIDQAFLNPNDLVNCIEAAELIDDYLIDENALIIIRADYDVDGITSGYVLGAGLRRISQCEVIVSYPEREEGYGLKMPFCEEVLKLISKKKPSKTLLITVDNGIASVEEIQFMKEHDVKTVVIDHHNPKDTLPNCLIVDPWKDDDTTFRHLCGVGLAFKVIQVLYNKYEITEELNQYLTAVTLGTISDMMPMTLENIAFCVYGLDQMNSEDCAFGIQALKEYLGKSEWTFSDIGWEIGPRINACGRMGNTQLASRLFFNDDLSYDDILNDIVSNIDKMNIDRKEITNQKMQEIQTQINEEDQIIVAVTEECPVGLAGVIVNKLIGLYHKPSIVLVKTENDLYCGSARSIDNVNILEILDAEQEANHTLLAYGGHDQAAGITITQENLDCFIHNMHHVSIKTSETTQEEPELIIDSTLELKDVTMDNFKAINVIPYDKSNLSEPIFEFEVVVLKYNLTKNGDKMWLYITDSTMQDTDKNDYKALKLLLMNETMDLFSSLKNKNKIRIAGTLATDFLNNHKSVTIRIVDMKECSY